MKQSKGSAILCIRCTGKTVRWHVSRDPENEKWFMWGGLKAGGASRTGERTTSAQVPGLFEDLHVTDSFGCGPGVSPRQFIHCSICWSLFSISSLELSFIHYLPPMCQALLNTLCVLLLIPSVTLRVTSYCPHFRDGETETHVLSVMSIWFWSTPAMKYSVHSWVLCTWGVCIRLNAHKSTEMY